MSTIVPFGKYKGQPVESLMSDAAYVDWIRQQDWLATKFPQINTLIINNFAEATETPEHNAMQALFFDDAFLRNYVKFSAGFMDFDFDETNYETEKIRIQAEHHGFDIYLQCGCMDDCIELKPCLGDDYPAVIRQIHNAGHKTGERVLIIKEYSGVGCDYDTLVKIFKSSKIRLIKLSDIK